MKNAIECEISMPAFVSVTLTAISDWSIPGFFS